MNINKLRIINYPDPRLLVPAKPVEMINDEIRALSDKMIDLMIEASGIGLAAPQVGVGLRLFVNSLTCSRDDALVFINPELSDFEGESVMEEGCLSLPGIHVKVKRPASCVVKAQNLEGKLFEIKAEELESHNVQHETDHLDGRLIIDRIGSLDKMACRKKLKQLEKEYENAR